MVALALGYNRLNYKGIIRNQNRASAWEALQPRRYAGGASDGSKALRLLE